LPNVSERVALLVFSSHGSRWLFRGGHGEKIDGERRLSAWRRRLRPWRSFFSRRTTGCSGLHRTSCATALPRSSPPEPG
jgi:hypothetical protein